MKRVFVAYFDEEHAVVEATRAAREAGLTIHDVYTPYAVHGLDAAMGLRPSRLTWVCFIGGLTGFASAVSLQYYTSVVSWPLNIGGKPFNSVPAFIPVSFELTVLFAALSSVLALLIRTRLRPSLGTCVVPKGVTNDRFALALSMSEGSWTDVAAQEICARFGAVEQGVTEVSR